MATLTNNIRAQNIIDRFADYVVATANAGIVWGTNAVPFPEFPTSYFGGTTAGQTIAINGTGTTGAIIKADDVFTLLLTETFRYTNIKNLTAILNVTGGGGNTGSRGSPGIVFNQTSKAHMAAVYRLTYQSTAVSRTAAAGEGDINALQIIKATGLEAFFQRLLDGWIIARNAATTIQIDVCHASCHSNCHGSRSRR